MSNWSLLIGTRNVEGVELTLKTLEEWEANPDRELICIFCGRTLPFDTRFCPLCKEYKGLGPYILGWSDWE